jgi:hypothetical protein
LKLKRVAFYFGFTSWGAGTNAWTGDAVQAGVFVFGLLPSTIGAAVPSGGKANLR